MKTILALLLLCTSPALARLGETREQCDARYGKPVAAQADPPTQMYDKAGLLIVCKFDAPADSTCRGIAFCRSGPGSSRNEPLIQVEIDLLLKASSEGKTWIKDSATSSATEDLWTRDGARASYNKETHLLTIIRKD